MLVFLTRHMLLLWILIVTMYLLFLHSQLVSIIVVLSQEFPSPIYPTSSLPYHPYFVYLNENIIYIPI